MVNRCVEWDCGVRSGTAIGLRRDPVLRDSYESGGIAMGLRWGCGGIHCYGIAFGFRWDPVPRDSAGIAVGSMATWLRDCGGIAVGLSRGCHAIAT